MRCCARYRTRSRNDFSLSQKVKEPFFSTSRETKPFFSTVIQTRLSVNQPGDAFEKEADALADNLVNKRTPSDRISLQQDSTTRNQGNIHGGTAPAFVESGIENSRGGGANLPPGIKAKMEESFNSDFSKVRIHTDASAVQLSRGLNAKAFTTGNDIYFNNGEYNPNTQVGLHLLAHELTHVVQQGQGIHKADDETNPVHDSIVGNGTTDELKAEIARLEQYLVDHPNTEWKTAIQNKLKSLRVYLKERGNSPMADCDAQLTFNGFKLFFTAGRSDSFPAVSGEQQKDDAGNTYFDYSAAKQKVPGGPIPEGTYWLDPSQIAWIGLPFIKDNDPAWGNHRITIHPFHSTHTFARGGFFIHGGSSWGSIGCIDLTSYMDSFAGVLSNYNNCGFWSCDPCKVLLTVKYTPNKVILKK